MLDRSRIPLDALTFFDAAMRHASFAAAAGEMNVSASAVSQRIKTIEDALGVRLFERQAQGLQPTEAAHLYLLEIRPALTRIKEASLRASSKESWRSRGRGRQLSIDMLPALAALRIAPKLSAFAERFPDITLRLTTSFTISDPLRDGFDCCVRYGPGQWAGVETELLAHEDVFLVCAPSLLAQHPIRNLSDVLHMPLVHDLMPMGWPEMASRLDLGPLPEGGLIFSDSSIALRAAVEGMGVAVGREHLVAPDLAAGRLVRLSTKTVRSPFSYWLIRPTDRSDRLVDLFSSWLVETVFS